jgi:hypothetical protein
MKPWWHRLRSVRGQLELLGVVFAGAVVIAVIILFLRESVFEYYAREKYPQPEENAKAAIKALVDVLVDPASTKEQIDDVGKKLEEKVPSPQNAGQPQKKPDYRDLEAIYGTWMLDDALDPGGNLAKRLTRMQPDWVFRRIRVTLVAGSTAQQTRALTWLRFVASEFPDRVDELATYARRKAERRGDVDLRQQADAVLALGRPRDGEP